MNKACPVVTRQNEGILEILAFLHPLAGKQLVKGTVEPGEMVLHACERELFEESGLHCQATRFVGIWESNFENQIWGFYLMNYDESLAESWEHFTNDGGGLLFSFFWYPLDSSPDSEWHPLFQGALSFLRSALLK